MVADFSWVEYNATAGDTGVVANVNMGSTNARALAPSTYPITAGTYSFNKLLVGNWSGTFTRIENLQFWCSASGSGYVTGETIAFDGTTSSYAGTSTYATPTNGAAVPANPMVFADPAAANIGIGGSLTGSLESAGESDFINLQMSVTGAASAGATQTKTFTLQYDEV